MRENLTHAIEDYLKAIYELTRSGDKATTTQLADLLDVTPASVTGMIQKLAASKPAMVVYRKHRGVALTAKGERVALEIMRHHRLIEMFLHEKLGFSWDEVHEEADRLEHVISEDFAERIAHVLGDPTHDPHGDPIPTRELEIPDSTELRLSELRPPAGGIVRRVRDSDPDLLRHFSKLGIMPGVSITVLDYSSYDDNLSLKVSDKDEVFVLGKQVTSQVFVDPN